MMRTLLSFGMMLGVAAAASDSFVFTSFSSGNISGYDHIAPGVAPTWKNDASGAARVGNINIIVDDTTPFLRMWNAFQDEATYGVDAPLPTVHKDLEAATQINDGTQLLISCSMTIPGDDDYNRISLYDVDQINIGVYNERSFVMRDTILDVLNSTLGQLDPAWFARTQMFEQKNGNLNIEGISVTGPGSDYDFVWGVRGPLFGADFATFQMVNGKSTQILDSGKAILIFVKDLFNNDNNCETKYHIELVDLQGKGVRSIEYIPALEGYLISSGPIPKADEYGLWVYRPADNNGHPSELINVEDKLPEFHLLGRPEGILREPNNWVRIFSEDDPTFAVIPPFNFLSFHVDYPQTGCPVVPRCQLDVSSVPVSSWRSGTDTFNQYNLAIHNPIGTTASSISFQVSSDDAARIQSVWNLENKGNGEYTLPTWSNTIAPGASYSSAGYISKNGPINFNLASIAC